MASKLTLLLLSFFTLILLIKCDQTAYGDHNNLMAAVNTYHQVKYIDSPSTLTEESPKKGPEFISINANSKPMKLLFKTTSTRLQIDHVHQNDQHGSMQELVYEDSPHQMFYPQSKQMLDRPKPKTSLINNELPVSMLDQTPPTPSQQYQSTQSVINTATPNPISLIQSDPIQNMNQMPHSMVAEQQPQQISTPTPMSPFSLLSEPSPMPSPQQISAPAPMSPFSPLSEPSPMPSPKPISSYSMLSEPNSVPKPISSATSMSPFSMLSEPNPMPAPKPISSSTSMTPFSMLSEPSPMPPSKPISSTTSMTPYSMLSELNPMSSSKPISSSISPFPLLPEPSVISTPKAISPTTSMSPYLMLSDPGPMTSTKPITSTAAMLPYSMLSEPTPMPSSKPMSKFAMFAEQAPKNKLIPMPMPIVSKLPTPFTSPISMAPSAMIQKAPTYSIQNPDSLASYRSQTMNLMSPYGSPSAPSPFSFRPTTTSLVAPISYSQPMTATSFQPTPSTTSMATINNGPIWNPMTTFPMSMNELSYGHHRGNALSSTMGFHASSVFPNANYGQTSSTMSTSSSAFHAPTPPFTITKASLISNYRPLPTYIDASRSK